MPFADNKRIAKNTLSLYIRMGVIMLVKLYTSRVLLNVLGIDDYGVWNAVAAFVISFSFISSPLVTATQRFLNFEMGKGGKRLRDIFTTSIIFFTVISIVVAIALETIGLWFLNSAMNFPDRVHDAVNVLFHISVCTLVVNLLRMPFESSIIAGEKMSFYAVVCIIEAFLMFGTAIIVQWNFGLERLIVYGAMNLLSAILILIIYKRYCNKKISYTILHKFKCHKNLIKEMAVFFGWNLFGACASMSATHGITTLINIFFGVAINAAYGIAIQVQGAVSNIVQNFQKAANPQIVKSYAENNLNRMQFLIVTICKFSYLLTLLFAVPMIFNMDYILHLWLGNNVPPMANYLSCLVLILMCLISFSGPMDTAILSSGKIKSFQIIYSIIIFSNIVIAYIFFKLGFLAYWALIIKCAVELIIIIVRLNYLKKQIRLGFIFIMRETFIPCIVITIISVSLVYILCNHIYITNGWFRFLMITASYFCILIPSIWFLAISKKQRHVLYSMIRMKMKL